MSDSPVQYKVSEDLSWGDVKKLIDGHPDINDEMKIATLRFKGSSNLPFVMVDNDGEIVAHD